MLSDKITTWIKDYANEHKMKTLVVGVSGGIDSAAAACVAAAAVGLN